MEYLRINFNQMFQFLPDGRIEPKARIRIGSVELSPGIQFARGVQFSGIDLFNWLGKDLAVDKEKETWVVKGFYA